MQRGSTNTLESLLLASELNTRFVRGMLRVGQGVSLRSQWHVRDRTGGQPLAYRLPAPLALHGIAAAPLRASGSVPAVLTRLCEKYR
jgi:hypothetical protein